MNSSKEHYIVITGGAGFIGSNLIEALNLHGYRNLIIIDNLKSGEKWKNLVGKTFSEIVPKEQGLAYLENKKKDIQAIFHLGACSDTTEINADYLLDNNYRYSVKLAEFALNHQIRFIYASSAATYGNGEAGFDDEDLEVLRPLNMYGYSKQLFDLWLKNQGVLDQVAGLKYFNVYGPNEAHKNKMASFVFKAFPKVIRGKPVELFASDSPEYRDGEQRRDFIYVKDAIRITICFLNNSAGGIYNVGSGIASTWNELANALFDAVDMPLKITYRPMPNELVGKYQNYSCSEKRKLQSVIGKEAECQYSLKEGVFDYVRNYLLDPFESKQLQLR